jgi:cellulose biosynthesis protein BcsQ
MATRDTTCPSCLVRLRLKEELTGKLVRCPRCKCTFIVPEADGVGVRPEPPRRVRAYVSHSPIDRAFVRDRLEPLLVQHQIHPWWSEEGPRSGELWEKQLHEAVLESDWFLLVASPHAAASDFVKAELAWALKTRPGRVVPILAQPCTASQIHPRLAAMRPIDFTDSPDRAAGRLLAAMLHRLHHDAREATVEVEQLSEQTERLKEDLQTADRQRAELADQIQGVLRFDGAYTHTPRQHTPPFRPLSERSAPIVAVLNLKGGVGKTTLTANLGAALWSARPSRRVLLVDLDYQANLSLACLGPGVLRRLGRSRRLVQELFREDGGDPSLALRCIEPIPDDTETVTSGSILACDSQLHVEETQALMRWLVGGKADLRYLLRSALHSDLVQGEFDYVLLDCPPRLGPACVNALAACDRLLVPVILDEKSTEGPPQLLSWIWERREALDLHVGQVALLANKTKGKTRQDLVGREKERWGKLVEQCGDAWPGELVPLSTVVPLFTEEAMGRKFPARYAAMRDTFAAVVGEMEARRGAAAG